MRAQVVGGCSPSGPRPSCLRSPGCVPTTGLAWEGLRPEPPRRPERGRERAQAHLPRRLGPCRVWQPGVGTLALLFLEQVIPSEVSGRHCLVVDAAARASEDVAEPCFHSVSELRGTYSARRVFHATPRRARMRARFRTCAPGPRCSRRGSRPRGLREPGFLRAQRGARPAAERGRAEGARRRPRAAWGSQRGPFVALPQPRGGRKAARPGSGSLWTG